MNTTKHNITNTAEPIKPGYKKTPVGIIPEDWEVKKLSSEINILGGNAFKSSDSVDAGVKWLKIANVGLDEIKYNPIEYLPSEYKELYEQYLLKKRDFVMALTRPILNGKLKISEIKQDENWLLNQRVAKLEPILSNIHYIVNLLKMPIYCYYLEVLMAGTDPPNLSLNDFKKLLIPVPPLPEQNAIADCLSTWDKGIEKLSALIASKKEQKKGLMQGLFSGKLKVENGELVKVEDEKLWLKGWKEVRLGDIGVFRTSSVNKKIVESETKVWLLNYMDVYKNTHITSEIEFQLTSAKDSQIESSSLKLGDILFTPSSETPDDIGHSAVVTENLENVVFSYHLVRFRVKKNLLDIDFSGHVFNKSDILNEFSRRATGSTRYTLSLKDFNEVKIKLPELKEQKTISNVLSTADKEIELLEKKLESFKTQKKGLMQVLLTGEKRLVDS